ncbi:hypothetical protein COO60DRAFT_924606 [Scenedesmus sp. NREL 46B-D3]|nr:hypothetical protein COO60DRAFT_924606 [Scenedesmus sp. NREL 46B-D3]
MDGVVTRVGLQLLLEPASTAWIARGACVATGAVYPAYATYKAVLAPKRPPPPGLSAAAAGLEAEGSREALLKYWAVFGLACLAERLLEHHIDRAFPYYPHAKLAFLLWLQLHNSYVRCSAASSWPKTKHSTAAPHQHRMRWLLPGMIDTSGCSMRITPFNG